MPAFAVSESLQAAERTNPGDGSGRRCSEPERQSLPGSGGLSGRARISQGHAEKRWSSRAALGKGSGSSGLVKQPQQLLAQQAGSVTRSGRRGARGTAVPLHVVSSSHRSWRHAGEINMGRWKQARVGGNGPLGLQPLIAFFPAPLLHSAPLSSHRASPSVGNMDCPVKRGLPRCFSGGRLCIQGCAHIL